MPLLNQLAFIEVVAREQSIRKASEYLAITSTALNRRLLALEHEVGTPLFERLPRGVKLNSAGELLLQHIRRSDGDLARVLSQIADLSGLRRGLVRILTSPELESGLIVQTIMRYQMSFPAVQFSLSSASNDTMSENLAALEVDLALSVEPLQPTQVRRLGRFVLPVVARLRPDHPLATEPSLRLYQCSNYPLVLPPKGTTLRLACDVAAMKQSLTLRPVLITQNPGAVMEFAATQQVIGFAYQQQHPDDGLVNIPINQRDISPNRIGLFLAKGRVLAVQASRFCDLLLQELSEAFAEG